MNYLIEDSLHSVNNITREGSSGDYRIKWTSTGLKHFIVINGRTKQDVILKNNTVLQQLIDESKDKIVENLVVVLSDVNIFYLSFSDLMKNGGLSIKEKPGYYAVYGCEIDNNSIVSAYYSDTNEKTINISVEIELNQSNYYVEERHGVFGRKIEKKYSGYKIIQIPRGISGIPQNSVKYYTPEQQVLSIPQTILEHGGKFFIKYDENQSIRFVTNNTGIRIK